MVAAKLAAVKLAEPVASCELAWPVHAHYTRRAFDLERQVLGLERRHRCPAALNNDDRTRCAGLEKIWVEHSTGFFCEFRIARTVVSNRDSVPRSRDAVLSSP